MKFAKNGFTLIELLIVIAIILLMAVAAVPAYQNYGAKSELSLKADEIKALIDRAEAYSKNPAQNQNCAQVSFSIDSIKIQFGNFDVNDSSATGCTIDSSRSTISSRDIVYISAPLSYDPSPSVSYFYSYYPSSSKFIAPGGASYDSNKIILNSSKTGTRHMEITIQTTPYNSSVKLIK